MRGFRNFAKGIGGAVLRSGDGSVDSAVELLLQRTADGVLADDRREALADLRDLLSHNSQAQLAVGAQGLPVLCTIIKEEREDTDMLRAALECLTIAIGNPTQHSESSGKGPQPAALNAELFSRGKDNIGVLLCLLDDEPVGVSDFYVRYHTVQLLTALAAVSSYRIQEAILAAPMGVIHLMDMMTDMEALRNEVLLLLIGLTHSNQSIQQIAAFEGAFERLLNIIRDEGGADGGIVVQDCLEMMNNLLRGNSKNQCLFREMGHLSNLPGLLKTQANIHKALPRQKYANLLAALDSLYLLLAAVPQQSGTLPEHPSRQQQQQQQPDKAGTQITLLKAGCLEALLHLLASSSVIIHSQALKCVWQLIEGNHACQQRLLEASVPNSQGMPAPALQAVLHIALQGADMRERVGALKVLLAFCIANTEGQQALINSMRLPSTQGGSSSVGTESSSGSELVQCLMNSSPEGLQVSGRAARVLSYLLADNQQCKQALLGQEAQETAQRVDGSISQAGLLPFVANGICALCSNIADISCGDGEPQGQALHLYMLLLITWLAGYPPAVKGCLRQQPLVPAWVSCIKARENGAHSITAGLAATLLCACLTTLPQGEHDDILEAIKHQVGVSDTFAAMQSMQQTPEFAAGLSGLQVSRQAPPAPSADLQADGADDVEPQELHGQSQSGLENPFDPQSTQLILAVEQEARQRLLGRQAADSMNALTPLAQDSSIKLQQAESQIQHLQRQLQQLSTSDAAGHGSSAVPDAKHASAVQHADQLAAAQQACEQAQATSANLQNTVQSLTSENSELRLALTAARQAEQDALSSAQRLETELSDLASAYNNVEVQSYQLEAQIKRLQNQAGQSGVPVGKAVTEVASPTLGESSSDAEETAMDDLLTCLGIEEAKVQLLQAKLEELGIDTQALLDSIDTG